MAFINSRLLLLLIIFANFTSPVNAQPERYIEGRDYQLIEEAAIDNTSDIIEVEEYFWYGCPGCFQFDYLLEEWLNTIPPQISFTRFPALWSGLHEVHARAYYTALELGELDSLHTPVFEAMHLQGNRFRNEDELGEFFAQNGISREEFNNAYNSFSVTTAISRADQKARSYRVRNTPSMIVNGKYIVNLRADTLEIVDFLIRKELLL